MRFRQRLRRRIVCVSAVILLSTRVSLAQAVVADDDTLAAAGIRKLASQHLTLYTDLPSRAAVDELPSVFDLAIPEWAKFFGFEAGRLDDWHIVGCVMRDRKRFLDYGLMPANLPPFLNGYQADNQVWVMDQPSDYYRRHLLLHEGTHAVMQQHFGHIGPAWYGEGMAELLGTHRLLDGKLQLAYFPRNKQEVEHWGRIKLIRDDVRAGKTLSLWKIANYRSRDFLNVESYAWCWALSSFCHQHPRLQSAFRNLQNELNQPYQVLTEAFRRSLDNQAYEIDAAWTLFLDHLDYGYDVAAEAVEYRPSQPLPTGGTTVTIDAAKAWQSTGVVVSAGQSLIIEANGRYQVGQQPRPWWCEPQGVTIEYYQKRPLGMLLGAIVDPDAAPLRTALTHPLVIGRRRELTSERGGILFLRINERADGLRDNRGSLTVQINAG